MRGRQKIRDRDAFDKLTTFVINNFGASITKRGLVDRLGRNAGLHTTRKTVDRYLQILENARILEPCIRFDLKSRRSLGVAYKYYLADLGIYFSLNTDARVNYGPVLENILYLYLRSKGYTLSVGKVGNLECDFIARKYNSYAYIQVATTISDTDTEEREYCVFRNIRDGYPRFLFTLDPLLLEREGVTHLNLRDFMTTGGELIR